MQIHGSAPEIGEVIVKISVQFVSVSANNKIETRKPSYR